LSHYVSGDHCVCSSLYFTDERIDPELYGASSATANPGIADDFTLPEFDAHTYNNDWDVAGTDLTQLMDFRDLDFWSMSFDPIQ
jgi:hypothetical protein